MASFPLRPNYSRAGSCTSHVYFWCHKNDHSSAPTLGFLMRITHNQDVVCIFVVFEAQLLAILLAKDPMGPRFIFFYKIWLVETRNFSLEEQYYSTAGANWLVQTSNTYLENNAGQIVRHQCYQLFTKCCVTKWGFSKISRDPSRGFSW